MNWILNSQNTGPACIWTATGTKLLYKVNNSHVAKTYLCRKNLWRGQSDITHMSMWLVNCALASVASTNAALDLIRASFKHFQDLWFSQTEKKSTALQAKKKSIITFKTFQQAWIRGGRWICVCRTILKTENRRRGRATGVERPYLCYGGGSDVGRGR